MAEYAVTVVYSDVKFDSWLKTSYTGLGIVSEDGSPMLKKLELGPDREDAFLRFFNEAAQQVLKVYAPRQGDLVADPYDFDGTNVVYYISSATPELGNIATLIESLEYTTMDAIYHYIAYLWFKYTGIDDKSDYAMARYEKFLEDIDVLLHKIHD